MGTTHFKSLKHCRWCGKPYHAEKPHRKDGFDKPPCKQAHYRAFKKWVTGKQRAGSQAQGHRVTPKKRKKRIS